MSDDYKVKFRSEDLPDRGDGVDRWHRNHIKVAIGRAQGKTYQQCADSIPSIKVGTAKHYVNIPGFNDLVEHFEQMLFEATAENALKDGSQECLGVLREAATDEDNPVRERISAAKKYLDSTGYKKFAERFAELYAEKKMGREGGSSEDVIRDLLGLHDDE